MILPAAVLAAAIMVAGCNADTVHFSDSIDFVFDFAPLPPGPRPDRLNTPYVLGTEFNMYAKREHTRMDLERAVAVSEDPGVMEVVGLTKVWSRDDDDEVTSVKFRCRATGGGTTDIVLYKDSDLDESWGSTEVTVKAPNQAELYFSGPVLLEWPFESTEVEGGVNVLEGGTATFLVHYYRDGERLHGHGILEPSVASGDAQAWSVATYWDEDRDWLQTTINSTGAHEIDLRTIEGKSIGILDVLGVTEQDIAYFTLEADDERDAEEDDVLAVLAVSYTDDDEPIYGVEYEWSTNGSRHSETGDIYKYHYQEGTARDVVASFGPHAESVVVHCKNSWVTSSNQLNHGCTLSRNPPPAASSGVVLLALAALAVVALRLRGAAVLRPE